MEDFDLNNTIPVTSEKGTQVRALPLTDDFDLDKTKPVSWIRQNPEWMAKTEEFRKSPIKSIGKGMLP